MNATFPGRRDQRYGVALPALRFYRANRGLSQETLARKAGISASTILHIEKYGGRARLATITALAQALRVERAALTLPAPEAHPARAYLPPASPHMPPAMPPITRPPSLDLAAVDPAAWQRPPLPPNVVSFTERAEAARVRRDARRDLERRTRSHREPWA